MISPLWIPLAGTAIVPVTVIGSIIAVAYARRIKMQPPPPASLPADVMARLERIEQAVDSIAVEVERVSEGQRFTTKLLAGKADADAGIASPSAPPGLPS